MGNLWSKAPNPATTQVTQKGSKRESCRTFSDCSDHTREHRSRFVHSTDIPAHINYSDRPPCWYWEKCYRGSNMDHMAKYLHPWELIESEDEVRLALIGKTGAGKSAAGNTILQQDNFKSEVNFTAQTSSCAYSYVSYGDKKYMIVDTPGVFDNRVDKRKNCAELIKCLALCAPGPHVFLITIEIGRYTKEDEEVIDIFKEMFGEGMMKHTIILFTSADKLERENKTIEAMKKEAPESLKKLISSSGCRTFAINNIADRDERTSQAEQLIAKIKEWGLGKTIFKDKLGVLKSIDNIFKMEEHNTGVSRENLRESIVKGLRKARPFMKAVTLAASAFGGILLRSKHPIAIIVGGVLTGLGIVGAGLDAFLNYALGNK